ncbi:MAG TPA: DCC1-like thiol-disulfide oxidoreductase family protein [Blastocatellia bacterium]|nr:DCC1-like thiol-disulfide oxidoreductase family protein [Blastocatellia bacterium]
MRSENQWTGGQYSVFRAIFGTYLFVHFAQLMPWGAEMFSNRGMLPDGAASPLLRLFPNILALYDSPTFVMALLVFAAGASLLFAIGLYDRAAAIAMWYAMACLFGRNPLIANPSLPYVGLLLLAHACLPRAPYGSFERRGQIDPGGGWRAPQEIYLVVWILMALGYSYSGYTKLISPSWADGTALGRVLDNPLARPGALRDALLALPPAFLRAATWGALALELLFAPLALSRKLRPWLWAAMLAMHLGLIALIDFADLSLGMVMLHLFTFDPGWVKPLRTKAAEMIFYDGRCGLCHRAVRFILAEDRRGEAFRFAPLGGEVFHAAVNEGRRAALPDSLVVLTVEGELLSRSSAVLYVMRRLGGMWRMLALIGQLPPIAWRDGVYNAVARARYRLFRKPESACPLLPGHLRSRFE